MKRHDQDINPETKRFELPFEHADRKYRLMKREQTQAAPWYVRMAMKGVEHWRSTDTNDPDGAISKGKEIIDAIRTGDEAFLVSTKLKSNRRRDRVAALQGGRAAKRYPQDVSPQTGRFEVPLVHEGRLYHLIKREQSLIAPWYLRLGHNGKDVWRSTDTFDPELAKNKAKRLIDAVRSDDKWFLAETKLRDPVRYATLKQIFEVYRAKAAILHRTIENNIGALKAILRKTRGADLDVDGVTTAFLTGRLVRDFQGMAIEKVKTRKLPSKDERSEMARAQRTADSTWLQARSIFSSGMVDQYKDAGLVFPSGFETDFCKAKKILLKTERRRYVQPVDEIILGTLAAARKMMAEVRRAKPPVDGQDLSGRAMDEAAKTKREARTSLDLQDRMVIVFALEIGCGLRKGELIKARGGWIGKVNEQLCVSLPADITKNGLPRRLQIPAEFEEYVLDYLKRRAIAAEDPLLRNAERVAKAVSAWLRKLGWTGTKTNHALRKYFGYLVAKTHGIAAAQWALDHSDLDTVQIYTGIMKGDGLVVELPTAVAPNPKILPMPAAMAV
jgi:hypothetical protein